MGEILFAILIAYLAFEVLLTVLTTKFMPIYNIVVECAVRLIFKERACRFGYHTWKYEDKPVQGAGLRHIRHTVIYTRCCTGECKKKQHSWNHPNSNLFDKWHKGIPDTHLSVKKIR